MARLIDTERIPAVPVEWARRVQRGARAMFWLLWLMPLLLELMEFTLSTAAPLFVPKKKLPQIYDVLAHIPLVTVVLGLVQLVFLRWLLTPPPWKERRLAAMLRTALPPLATTWLLLTAVTAYADLTPTFRLPGFVTPLEIVLWAALTTATLVYLGQLLSGLGQIALSIIATVMAVFAWGTFEAESTSWAMVGGEAWQDVLPMVLTAKLAAAVVAIGGAQLCLGRLSRLLRMVIRGRVARQTDASRSEPLQTAVRSAS